MLAFYRNICAALWCIASTLLVFKLSCCDKQDEEMLMVFTCEATRYPLKPFDMACFWCLRSPATTVQLCDAPSADLLVSYYNSVLFMCVWKSNYRHIVKWSWCQNIGRQCNHSYAARYMASNLKIDTLGGIKYCAIPLSDSNDTLGILYMTLSGVKEFLQPREIKCELGAKALPSLISDQPCAPTKLSFNFNFIFNCFCFQ